VNTNLLYLDSSAIIKLVLHEPETAALYALLEEWPKRISSVLARVEVLRGLRRAGVPAADHHRGEQILRRLGLFRLDDTILAAAASLDPPQLRSLDAIHLATALTVRDHLAALVTYDRRLAQAAAAAHVPVWTPGP
jgi:hypothetical protein